MGHNELEPAAKRAYKRVLLLGLPIVLLIGFLIFNGAGLPTGVIILVGAIAAGVIIGVILMLPLRKRRLQLQHMAAQQADIHLAAGALWASNARNALDAEVNLVEKAPVNNRQMIGNLDATAPMIGMQLTPAMNWFPIWAAADGLNIESGGQIQQLGWPASARFISNHKHPIAILGFSEFNACLYLPDETGHNVDGLIGIFAERSISVTDERMKFAPGL